MIAIMLKSNLALPPPFDELPNRSSKQVRLNAGEYLFYQGQETRAFYYVVVGAVSLLRHTEAGEKVTLFRAKKGDLVADASLFSKEYHCDCVSESESLLMSFSKSNVLQRIKNDPTFALVLIERLTRQVQIYRRQLELRAIKSAKKRVWAGICDGWLANEIVAFASSLGLSPEATYRALAELVREGKLRKNGHGLYTIK